MADRADRPPPAPPARPPRDLRQASIIVQRMARESGISGQDANAYAILHARAAAQIRSYVAMILFKIDVPLVLRNEVDVLKLLRVVHTVEEEEERRHDRQLV